MSYIANYHYVMAEHQFLSFHTLTYANQKPLLYSLEIVKHLFVGDSLFICTVFSNVCELSHVIVDISFNNDN